MSWMIRDSRTNLFSNGIIQTSYQGGCYVGWHRRGKVWTVEQLLKDHILKYAQKSVDGQCPDTWEVLEVVETAKPINEWIDADMVFKLLLKAKK